MNHYQETIEALKQALFIGFLLQEIQVSDAGRLKQKD